MKPNDILKRTSHRPWPLSKSPWRYYQEWNDAVFLHWKVDLTELRKHVPSDMTIDLHEGQAWVSLVAFNMEKVAIKNLPPINGISNFHELNIRTYVRYKDVPGVYFISIQAFNRVGCFLARQFTSLPYLFAKISRTNGVFTCTNKKENSCFHLEYKKEQSLSETGPLDHWLIERYALFQNSAQQINRFDIHHMPWSLSSISINAIRFDYEHLNRLIQGAPHRTHYSGGIQTVCWGKSQIKLDYTSDYMTVMRIKK
ncbi:MAG: hypothetical protein ACI9UJ_001037 [bacterium]